MADFLLDLSRPRRLHLVGVGGTGMSAIATVLAGMGHTVSGSDATESPTLTRLRELGVHIEVGHDGAHVEGGLDAVAHSTAIDAANPELVAARTLGLPVLRRAELLAAVAARKEVVTVGGTHGKTTTSSMLVTILQAADAHPSFVVGGEIRDLGTGGGWDDDGDRMVIEADESDGTFVELPRAGAILTSVEPDHLDFYGGFDALLDAFERYLTEVDGPRVVCADDSLAAQIAVRLGATTYGTSVEAHYRIVGLESGRTGTRFEVEHGGDTIAEVQLPLAGDYNARNATAALVMAVALGIDARVAADALGGFGGVARRLEHRGETAGVEFVDDYAHLPTEVRDALGAARSGGWARVVCVFQPHRYSRTAALGREFADAFGGADLLAVTDIYPAGEAPRPGVSGKLVADAVLDAHPWRRLAYLPGLDDVVAFLGHELRPGDLCLTLGAGDLTTIPEQVQAALTRAASRSR